MPRDERTPVNYDTAEVMRVGWDTATLAIINHDLRNGLASIASALQVLRMQGYVNPIAEQAGRTIERQAEHLALLADQLAEAAGVPREFTKRPLLEPTTRPPRTPETAPRRILVVDDNRDTAESTGLLLVLWGHQVRLAYDGPSAVKAAIEYRPDLCLIDQGMPEMYGFAVAEQLRRQPDLSRARLVALTGFDREAAGARANDNRFDAYLLKPVEMAALQETLAAGAAAAPVGSA
jgi:CheY-like chemotaxis protein